MAGAGLGRGFRVSWSVRTAGRSYRVCAVHQGNPAAVYAPGEDRAHLEMAEEVIDCVLTRVIEVVTESQRVASWTLAMTLDAAIEQAAVRSYSTVFLRALHAARCMARTAQLRRSPGCRRHTTRRKV